MTSDEREKEQERLHKKKLKLTAELAHLDKDMKELKWQITFHTRKQDEYAMQQEYIECLQSSGMNRYTESWQNILNFLMYTVLILNSFITAFGLTDQIKLGDDNTASSTSDMISILSSVTSATADPN